VLLKGRNYERGVAAETAIPLIVTQAAGFPFVVTQASGFSFVMTQTMDFYFHCDTCCGVFLSLCQKALFCCKKCFFSFGGLMGFS
jgi:hypothetical protein